MDGRYFEVIVNALAKICDYVCHLSTKKKLALLALPIFVGVCVLCANWYKIPLKNITSSVPANGKFEVIKSEKKNKPDIVKVTVCYSKRNRGTWFNIKRSAKKFNNLKLEPGGKFSWINCIGKCGKLEGYALGGGVDGLEYGGGICFTATAYFRLMYTVQEELEPEVHCKGYSHHDAVWYAPDRNDVTVDPENGVDLTSWNSSKRTLKIKVKVNESKRTVTFTGYLYPEE